MLQRLSLGEIVALLRRDLWAYRKPLALLAALLLIGLPALASRMSPSYISATSIYVEEKNILGSLMAGAAVQAGVVDRARIAREIIWSRSLMTEVLERNGWGPELSDPRRLEQLVDMLIGRTDISNRGKNLIRIEYRDTDPERVFSVTRDIAELFITESHEVKIEESKSAFEFINRQVAQYQQKLDLSEEQLTNFRNANDSARPGAETEVGRRIADLKTRSETIEQELRETKILTDTLKRQLRQASSAEPSDESLPPELIAKKTRLTGLRQELEELRLTYTDTYPDVVRAQRQLNDLSREIDRDMRAYARERQSRSHNRDASTALDTVYGNIQRELFTAQASIQTLESRLTDTRERLQAEIERSNKISNLEGRLVELEREYSVNNDIHKDLIKRREIARVSMDLATERQGLTLRIDQPAFFPHRPSGLRALHVMMAAPVLALLLPIGLIFGVNQFDWRARHPEVLAAQLQLEEVISIPHLKTTTDETDDRRATRASVLAVAGGALIWGALFAWTALVGSG